MSKAVVVHLLEFPEGLVGELGLNDNALYMTFWDNGKVSFTKEYIDPTNVYETMMEVELSSFLSGLKRFIKSINDHQGGEGYKL